MTVNKAREATLTAEVARELLDYCPETGALRWRERGLRWFKSRGDMSACNTKFAGKVAGYVDGASGYRVVRILDRNFGAHRVAYLIYYGHWPRGEIDHVNGHRDQNNIANIRAATSRGNAMNRALRSDNTSGYIGVTWHSKSGKWRARIWVVDRHIHLGCFEHKEDAIAARKAAEVRYGFHPNHGRAPTRTKKQVSAS